MSKNAHIRQAVILAGGKGERLKPLTNDRPKPMVMVNGRPFLEYLISLLKKNGIEEIVVLLGYMPEKVIEHFGDGKKFGVDIKYHISDVDFKNGTRIKEAADMLDNLFFLMFGDIYWSLDIKKMLKTYASLGTPALMTVYNNHKGDGEYGTKSNVKVSSTGLVEHYGELGNDPTIKGLDLGSYIFNKNLFTLVPKNDFSLQHDILTFLIKRNMLSAFQTQEPYSTITNPELLKKTERIFKAKNIVT